MGKAVKGRSKDKKRDKKEKVKDAASGDQMGDDIRMLEEYEKLNKLSEAQRIRLKKYQQQEAYNSKINKKLLLNLHRKFMRADKVEGLRKQIEILAQNHECEVDRKDAIVQMLTRDLDECEEQFQTAQRTHMDKLQKFVSLFEKKMAGLDSEFERDLKALKLEFNVEREQILTQNAREVKEMQSIIRAVEDSEQARISATRQDHEMNREHIRNKNLESINELRINLENKIEDLEKQFDEAHQNYAENTDQATKIFKQLQKDDRELSKDIDQKKRDIERMQANLLSWKKKIEHNYKECVARNQALREQKEAIAQHCNELKARMKKFRANENKKLTELTVMARDALKANQVKIQQAERILQLAELSRKMETEREKVTPFYESSVQVDPESLATKTLDDDDQELQRSMSQLHVTAVGADGKPIPEWGHLENFHKKFNKVLLDKLAIAEEKKRLAKENGDLRSILKQYLDGIAVTEDAVDKDNPLLIVNGRVNLLDRERRVRRMGRPSTITEATTVVRNNAAHVPNMGPLAVTVAAGRAVARN